MRARWKPDGSPLGGCWGPYESHVRGPCVSSGRATLEPYMSPMGALREHGESHMGALWEHWESQTRAICELYGSYLRALGEPYRARWEPYRSQMGAI